MGEIKVLGICGSLRKGSYNKMALAAAVELAPEGLSVGVFGRVGEIPLYDEDVKERGFPDAVEAFRRAIAESDALLFVTPEYNYSVSGALKNAVDWASRPPQPPVVGKPAAIMGASSGLMGTVRAQLHLRQILAGLNMPVLARPEVLIREAASKFDGAGRLIDEPTRGHIRTLLARLKDWAMLIRSGAEPR